MRDLPLAHLPAKGPWVARRVLDRETRAVWPKGVARLSKDGLQTKRELSIFHAWLESGGFRGEKIEAQMQYFAEEVTPGPARACGGQMKNPEVGLDFASQNGRAR